MPVGLLDLPPPPASRPVPSSGPGSASRPKPDADAERFAIPSDRAQADRPDRGAPAPKRKAVDTPARDGNASSRPAGPAKDAEDAQQVDAPSREKDAAGEPVLAKASGDAVPQLVATQQPGFLSLVRALGLASGKPEAGNGEDLSETAPSAEILAQEAASSDTAADVTAAAGASILAAEKPVAEEPKDLPGAADGQASEGQGQPTTPIPIVAMPLPPAAQAAVQGPSSEDGAARGNPVGSPVAAGLATRTKDAAPAADVSGSAAAKTMDGVSATASPGDVSTERARDAGAKSGEPSFAEHLSKVATEAAQTGATEHAGGAAPSTMPSFVGLSPASGAHGIHAPQATTTAAPHPVVSGVPIAAVPVEIGMKSLQGVNRFDIRLDPEDLGQIDVRLDISETGSVRAHIVVDRPEALVSLQRETTHLERALEQAGFKTDDGVSLSLRQQGQGEAGGGRGEGREGRPDPNGARAAEGDPAAATAPVQRGAWTRASGIDRHI